MAVYKVIQDVEAEDKLLGPLTFKGFIYAGIALLSGFINFKLLFLGTPLKWAFIPLFLLPMILFGVLASPLGRDQPTEVWLLSKIKFYIKPRRRIWDQSGQEELVTITAPKREEQHLAKDITQTEVRSRLKTLASTLDTRGWAIKNVDLNLNAAAPQASSSSDRLVPNAGYTQEAQVVDIHAADDILDEQNNPTAQKFAAMMKKSDDQRRRGILETMKGLVEDGGKKSTSSDTDRTGGKELEERLAKARSSFSSDHGKAKKSKDARHKILTAEIDAKKPKPTPVTPERQAVNMELAQSGSAFSVSTLSHLANRKGPIEQTGPNEVTISLH